MAKIGDVLVSKNIITEEQLQNALAEQQSSGDRLGDALVKLGYTTQEKIESALNG